MNDRVKLSQRVRANSEAAPWVIDEIVILENALDASEHLRESYDQESRELINRIIRLEEIIAFHCDPFDVLPEYDDTVNEIIKEYWER